MPTSTNNFSQGLKLSNDYINQVQGSYPYALNAVKENIINNPESISNEKGFNNYLNLGYEYILLGTRYLGKKEYVLFIMNKLGQTPFNRILLLKEGVSLTTLRDNLDLNFNSANPIRSTYRINYKNERLVYFVDGLNEDRVINIDIDTTALDISLLSINTTVTQPILNATVIDNGGVLLAGQYFIAISYNIENSFTTNPLVISKPISIASEDYYNNSLITKDLTLKFGQTDGDIIGKPTKKSIKIDLSQLDDNYASYNIIILRQEESVNIIRIIKNISLDDTSYIFTGTEGELDDTLSLNDIITSSINYYASEAIIQKDNRLIRGNSKLKSTSINYQEYANNILVSYTINEELVYNADLKNGYKTDSRNDGGYIDINDVINKHSISPSYLANTANNDVDNKTFMRDEVYSLGIAFELLDGSDTDVFHIPGRKLNTFKTNTGTGEYARAYTSNWDDDIVNSEPRWKVRNTALKRTNSGDLAYWRSTETYPDNHNFPIDGEQNISNKSYIRHHKMPSDILEPIYRTEITGDPNKQKGQITEYKIYKRNLGLNFSNINIPIEIRDKIKKIKFFFTPRDSSNKSIISKGITYALNNDNGSSNLFNSNITASDLKTKFEFISPDINFNFKQLGLSGSSIKVCGIDKGYVNLAGGKENINPSGAYYVRTFNNQLFDDTERKQGIINAYCFYNQRIEPKEDVYSRNINNLFYVDSNYKGSSDIGNIDFMGSQNTSIIELNEGIRLKPVVLLTPLADYYPELLLPSGSNTPSLLYNTIDYKVDEISGLNYGTMVTALENVSYAQNLYYDTTYYIQITNNISNLYGSIKNLKYIQVGSSINYNSSITTADINGGDTFIDVHHFKKTKTIPVSREIISGNLKIPVALNILGGISSSGALNTSNVMVEINEVGTQAYGSFFCETDVNIRMRREGGGDDEKYFPKSYISSTTLRDIAGSFDKKEYYQIDSHYNNQYIKLGFINYNDNTALYSEEDIRYSTRIIYSEKQNLEDKVDRYRSFKANNYRDLPLDKGGITMFFINKEKLFSLTRDTLFSVYTSNQTLRSSEETNITVGTGEFLGTEPIDLMTIDGGYAGCSSVLGFVESPFGYLFVDKNKGKIILFNDSMEELNIKDVSEFILKNYKIEFLNQNNELDLPLQDKGYICGYDASLQRFLITKLDKGDINKSFTISYSPIAKQWISFHSYLPNNYIIHPNSILVKNNDSQIMEMNKGEYGKYFTSSIKPFIIDTVFNENPLNTKVFDSIMFNMKTVGINNAPTNKFFDNLILNTEYQCTGNLVLDSTNLTKKERNWNINKFFDLTKNPNTKLFSTDWNDISSQYPIDKVINTNNIDLNKAWYLRGRLRDKYLVARFIENNLINSKIICNFVTSNYRLSQR